MAEVRAIGAATADAPGVHERDQVAARVEALLADPDDPELRDGFVRWAERTAVRAPTAEMRSAARMLLVLLRDGAPPAVLHTVDPPISFQINPRVALAVGIVAACLTAGGVMAARVVSTPTLHVSGPPANVPVGPATDGRLVFRASGSPALLRRERWTFDGQNVTRLVQRENGSAVFLPGHLPEGAHELSVTAGGGFLGASGRKTIDFTVDHRPIVSPALGPGGVIEGVTVAAAGGHVQVVLVEAKANRICSGVFQREAIHALGAKLAVKDQRPGQQS